jgi:hypothetical protein
MANTAQTRATRNYRRRLSARGVARFEVQAPEADRELIRALARRLSSADAQETRAAVRRLVGDEAPQPSGILAALRRSPLVGAEIDVTRERDEGRRVDL